MRLGSRLCTLRGEESKSRQMAPLPEQPIKILNEESVTGLTSLLWQTSKTQLSEVGFGCNKPAVTSSVGPLIIYKNTDKYKPNG